MQLREGWKCTFNDLLLSLSHWFLFYPLQERTHQDHHRCLSFSTSLREDLCDSLSLSLLSLFSLRGNHFPQNLIFLLLSPSWELPLIHSRLYCYSNEKSGARKLVQCANRFLSSGIVMEYISSRITWTDEYKKERFLKAYQKKNENRRKRNRMEEKGKVIKRKEKNKKVIKKKRGRNLRGYDILFLTFFSSTFFSIFFLFSLSLEHWFFIHIGFTLSLALFDEHDKDDDRVEIEYFDGDGGWKQYISKWNVL